MNFDDFENSENELEFKVQKNNFIDFDVVEDENEAFVRFFLSPPTHSHKSNLVN